MHTKALIILATMAFSVFAIPAETPAAAILDFRRDAAPTPAPMIPKIEARAEQKPTTEKSATCLKCSNGKCCKRGLVAVAEPTPLVVRGWIVEEEVE